MSNPYAIAAANNQRNLAKAAQLLVGICSGIVADGKVTDDEILFLQQWLQEHAEVTSIWPGNMIAKRIEDILADGIVTTEERDDLLITLQEISGNFFNETGVAQQDTPALPIDENPIIEINGKTVCFTGKFVFGSRTACEEAVVHYGGIPANTITKKLDYLVIGTLASPDWITSSYGRKIEQAVTYRNDHGRPVIISEQQWLEGLESQ